MGNKVLILSYRLIKGHLADLVHFADLPPMTDKRKQLVYWLFSRFKRINGYSAIVKKFAEDLIESNIDKGIYFDGIYFHLSGFANFVFGHLSKIERGVIGNNLQAEKIFIRMAENEINRRSQ